MKIITVEDHQARYLNDLLQAQRDRIYKEADRSQVSSGSSAGRAKAAELSRIDLIVLAIKDAEDKPGP